MYSEEVIERFKTKIPEIKGDHTIYGITQLDIECRDGSVKQIVLLFERLRVDEPETFLAKKKIYADVLIKISDKVLAEIATKEISIDDAVNERMFKVYGDAEIWQLQLNALKKILPHEHFEPIKIEEPKVETDEAKDEDLPDFMMDEWTDFSNLPQTDLSDVGVEFKELTDHFAALRNKYSTKKVSFQDGSKKE